MLGIVVKEEMVVFVHRTRRTKTEKSNVGVSRRNKATDLIDANRTMVVKE